MEKLNKVFEIVARNADKVAHFAVNFCIVLAAGVFRKGWLIIAGVLVAVVASVAKEIWDKVSGKGECDWKDLVADALGIAAALIFTGLGALV